jgi:hypothetical protein
MKALKDVHMIRPSHFELGPEDKLALQMSNTSQEEIAPFSIGGTVKLNEKMQALLQAACVSQLKE